MRRLSNPQNQVVKLSVAVQGTTWEQTLDPFSDIELPTEDHYQAVLPYLRDFKLQILGAEEGLASSTVATIEVVTVPAAPALPPTSAPSAPPSALEVFTPEGTEETTDPGDV